MQKILIIILIIITLALYSNIKSDQFYTAIGKIESDSDYCLSNSEIKAIRNASVTDEYKNYLFESDMWKRQAINKANQVNKYINCEL